MGETEINRDAVKEIMIADTIAQVVREHGEELRGENFGSGADLTIVAGWMLQCVDNRTPDSLELEYGLPAAEIREMMRQITNFPPDGVGFMPEIIKRLKQAAIDVTPQVLEQQTLVKRLITYPEFGRESILLDWGFQMAYNQEV